MISRRTLLKAAASVAAIAALPSIGVATSKVGGLTVVSPFTKFPFKEIVQVLDVDVPVDPTSREIVNDPLSKEAYCFVENCGLIVDVEATVREQKIWAEKRAEWGHPIPILRCIDGRGAKISFNIGDGCENNGVPQWHIGSFIQRVNSNGQVEATFEFDFFDRFAFGPPEGATAIEKICYEIKSKRIRG